MLFSLDWEFFWCQKMSLEPFFFLFFFTWHCIPFCNSLPPSLVERISNKRWFRCFGFPVRLFPKIGNSNLSPVSHPTPWEQPSFYLLNHSCSPLVWWELRSAPWLFFFLFTTIINFAFSNFRTPKNEYFLHNHDLV